MRAVRVRVRVLEGVMVGEGVESARPIVTAGLVEGRMMRPSPRPVILFCGFWGCLREV